MFRDITRASCQSVVELPRLFTGCITHKYLWRKDVSCHSLGDGFSGHYLRFRKVLLRGSSTALIIQSFLYGKESSNETQIFFKDYHPYFPVTADLFLNTLGVALPISSLNGEPRSSDKLILERHPRLRPNISGEVGRVLRANSRFIRMPSECLL